MQGEDVFADGSEAGACEAVGEGRGRIEVFVYGESEDLSKEADHYESVDVAEADTIIGANWLLAVYEINEELKSQIIDAIGGSAVSFSPQQ